MPPKTCGKYWLNKAKLCRTLWSTLCWMENTDPVKPNFSVPNGAAIYSREREHLFVVEAIFFPTCSKSLPLQKIHGPSVLLYAIENLPVDHDDLA